MCRSNLSPNHSSFNDSKAEKLWGNTKLRFRLPSESLRNWILCFTAEDIKELTLSTSTVFPDITTESLSIRLDPCSNLPTRFKRKFALFWIWWLFSYGRRREVSKSKTDKWVHRCLHFLANMEVLTASLVGSNKRIWRRTPSGMLLMISSTLCRLILCTSVVENVPAMIYACACLLKITKAWVKCNFGGKLLSSHKISSLLFTEQFYKNIRIGSGKGNKKNLGHSLSLSLFGWFHILNSTIRLGLVKDSIINFNSQQIYRNRYSLVSIII